MAADDRSRIKDLGKYDWDDKFRIPKLAAYEEPETEPSVKAVAGHMYLVHTRDTINNYYVLFRVEQLAPKENVEISWELLDPVRDLVAPSSSDDVKTGKIKTAKLQSRAAGCEFLSPADDSVSDVIRSVLLVLTQLPLLNGR